MFILLSKVVAIGYNKFLTKLCLYKFLFFFFLRDFQPMVSVFYDSFLSLDQDTNQFLI